MQKVHKLTANKRFFQVSKARQEKTVAVKDRLRQTSGKDLTARRLHLSCSRVRRSTASWPGSRSLILTVLPMTNLVLVPLVILALGGSSLPGEVLEENQARWPQFRGPSGQGVGREGLRLPVEFGLTSNVVWK